MISDNKNISAFDISDEPDWTPPPWPEGLPDPGIYHGIPFQEYKSWPACNASALKIAANVTAKHMRAYMSGLMDTDSPSRRFGRAQHCYMLEGLEAFESRISVATPCAAPIQKGPGRGNRAAVRASIGLMVSGTAANTPRRGRMLVISSRATNGKTSRRRPTRSPNIRR